MRDAFHADPADVSLAEAMHAMSDPLRLRIIDLLAQQGELECSTIYNALGISKSNASHHFRVLRETGLLLRTHRGQQQSARLRTEEFGQRFPGLLDSVLGNFRATADADRDLRQESPETAGDR